MLLEAGFSRTRLLAECKGEIRLIAQEDDFHIDGRFYNEADVLRVRLASSLPWPGQTDEDARNPWSA